MSAQHERAVLSAAEKWAKAPAVPGNSTALLYAVEQWLAARGDPVDTPLSWGEVCVEDEIYSPSLDKWYTVASTQTMGSRVKIRRRDVKGELDMPIGAKVRVRRGQSGKAMDLIVSVLSSGERK